MQENRDLPRDFNFYAKATMDRKGLAVLPLIVSVAVALVVIGALFLLTRGGSPPVSPPTANVPVGAPPVVTPPGQVVCTMEAKQCPDGSYVGRTGPNCEFAPCPATGTGQLVGCSGPDDASCPTGYQCVQDCGPPVARVGEPPPPYHCLTDEQAKRPRMCPICLARDTEIATPQGPVRVQDLTVNSPVWSRDDQGRRIISRVSRVSRSDAPPNHQVVNLTLADGRRARVSAGHPTVDGRRVGDLRVGESYDGTVVIGTERSPYDADYTYDLLPDSATGSYWADGIPLGSTLK